MNANALRPYWTTLFLLLTCALSAGRLIAEELDDEPVTAAPDADNATAADGAASSAEPARIDDEAASNEDPASADPGSDQPAVDGSGSDKPAGDEPVAAKPVAAKPIEAPAKPPLPAETSADENSTAAGDDRPVADAPADDDHPSLQPAERRLTVEAASFKGIQPGKSTAEELAASWGPPKEIRKQKGGRLQTYKIESFPKVTVTLNSSVVGSIVVNLEQPLDPEELAKQLSIDDISSVRVTDDKGHLLGEAFPERGVLFGYAPKSETPRVSQVVLEPIDAAPFLLRAETYLRTHFARCLADANTALEIDPKSAQAHGLRARVYFRAGDLSEALTAAQTAADFEPREADWNLLVAKILIEAADFKRAQQQLEMVLESSDVPALAQAKAQALLGDCLAAASAGDEQAMKHHQAAIKLAEPLVTNSRVMVRRGAKEVLLDAHLGMAVDVGWGHFQKKGPSIAKWVERAKTLAQDLVQHDQAEEDLLLRVDLQTLAALSGMSEPSDASPWTKDCLKRTGQLIEQSADSARTAQLEWQLGVALSDAAGIEQAHGHFEKSHEYGQLALKHLEAGESAGRHLPDHDFLLGRVFYRLGVTAAIGQQNHRRALESYSRAVKLLETPVPPSRLADSGRHGEMFVSIAVSYWELDKREESLRLTKQGIKLMEQAIDDGLLTKSALAVPYGNLASMHAELGNKQLADEFAELSAKCERTKR